MPRRLTPWLALVFVIVGASAGRSQQHDALPSAPVADSGKPIADVLPPALDGPDADEVAVVGRLRITTDADATIRIGPQELGVLVPGETLLHDVRELEGVVIATSIDTPAAKLREAYAFDESPALADPGALEVMDVHIRLLKAMRETRKTERKEGIFPDFKNGLMWRRKDNSADVTWKSAQKYCHELDFAGFEDWRLPRIAELDMLQAMWSRAAFKTLDPIALSACCPWSASEISEESAWHYNFRFRKAFEGRKGYSFGFRALCARALTDDELREHEAELVKRKKKKKKKGNGKPEDADFPKGDPLDDPSRRR